MKDRIVITRKDGTTVEFLGGKKAVEAVSQAKSKEELRKIMEEGGISSFSEKDLEEGYESLALSQNWYALMELFSDKDFESCQQNLKLHGISTTREHFDLTNEVLASAADDALLAELPKTTDIKSAVEILNKHGYHKIDEDFLMLVMEYIRHLREDALLTDEELQNLSGISFYERCKNSINLVLALNTIIGLAIGFEHTAQPAHMIAAAGWASLVPKELYANNQ